MQQISKERVITYIDGFNLYFGLKESGYQRYFWLNLHALAQKILKPHQELVGIKYFTTLIWNNIDSRTKQKSYLAALETEKIIKIYYGKFQHEMEHCKLCGNRFQKICEKTTDVNIATQLICDAYENRFDMAMIVSGDTDLIPPIKFINNIHNKRAFVAFPPNRVNDEVRKFANGDWVIGRKNLADCQFPKILTNTAGLAISRPETWE